MFDRPLQIGKLTIPNRAVLAPLAGVSDVPFRRICQEAGAGLTYVEMLSSVAVNRESERTLRMMARHADEVRLGIQVTGPDPESVAASTRLFHSMGFETIDLNMGCPVRKVVGKGWGSAILCDPQKAEDMVRACRAETDRPVSAKIRLGFTRNTMNVDEISERLTNAGADMLTIHGRCRSESYNRPVDRAGVKLGFDHARPGVVKLGNGDVMDHASGVAMMREAECDGVMVSRGALGNPWIFSQLVGAHDIHPTVAEWSEVLFRHLEYHEAHYGSGHGGLVRFRKHLLWYVTGFPASRKLRSVLSTTPTFKEVRKYLDDYISKLPPEMRRHSNSRMPDGDRVTAERDPKYDMDRKLDRGVGDDDGTTPGGS